MRSTAAPACSASRARNAASTRGVSTRATTRRTRVCAGGSASSSRLGGRHGSSLRKSVSPTPAEEQNASWPRIVVWACANRATPQIA